MISYEKDYIDDYATDNIICFITSLNRFMKIYV